MDRWRAAGAHYWAASLLPALAGATLPFWLRPRGFAFRPLPALEFLAATLLTHAGFSLLHAVFWARPAGTPPRGRLVAVALACLGMACLLGLHLDSGLTFHRGVPHAVFLIYGLLTLFAGVLYVVPPLAFCRRMGGEIVLAECLGLLPVLGAYLVQVGDLTRTVYVASGPLVVATALWVWTDELVTVAEDRRTGRGTLVILFGERFSETVVVAVLAVAPFAAVVAAILYRALPPLALCLLLLAPLAWWIGSIAWRGHGDAARMEHARRLAQGLYLTVSLIVVASPLAATLAR